MDSAVKPVNDLDERETNRVSDPFLRHVPEELHSKKTGMNVLIVTDYDIAGQPSLLFRTLNEQTIHKARLVVAHGDYLAYDRDIVLDTDGTEEAIDLVRHADFFHIGRCLVDIGPAVRWSDILTPRNVLIQYFGSEVRSAPEQTRRFHEETGILGLSGADWTMLEGALFLYHVKVMLDFARVPPADPPGSAIRIFHSPTSRGFKRTRLFLEAFAALKDLFPIELVLVEGKSNRECLLEKKRCQITLDQISTGAYGLAAVESMAMGHAVLCGISNFWTSCFPENPIVYVTPETLKERLVYLIERPDEIVRIGEAGKVWARRYHDPRVVVRQYLGLYDLIMNGHRLMPGADAGLLKGKPWVASRPPSRSRTAGS